MFTSSVPTQFITLVTPPCPSVDSYLASDPPPSSISQGFLDAMVVRKRVFIDEQHCRLENEVDSDDARSWHWVAHASMNTPSSNTTDKSSAATTAAASDNKGAGSSESEYERRKSEGGQVPVGTVRLVPPPHAGHPVPGSVDGVGGEQPPSTAGTTEGNPTAGGDGLSRDRPTKLHDGREAYVKIGRLATVKEYRGFGMGKLLVLAALEWAAKNRDALQMLPDDPVEREKMIISGEGSKDNKAGNESSSGGSATGDRSGAGGSLVGWEWNGLVMAHSQKSAVRFYERLGFTVDTELGEWVEEGIEHVAMWKRLELVG